ncbi:MAG: peptidase M14 [Ruminococcaceae bacterium]|nr:peptidase M14 [Oscillospiraceae bacterium]
MPSKHKPYRQTDQPLDHQALMKSIHMLAEQYPFLFVTELGKSILGKEIPLLRIGSGEKSVLYVGAHHGMEWLTASLLLRYTRDLCEGYAQGRSAYKLLLPLLLERYTVLVIPMLNPDGVDYHLHGVSEENPLRDRALSMNQGSNDFAAWQANARGVDLNHNYNAGFWEYKRLEAEEKISCGAPTRYSGQEPESEPETRALCDLIRFQKDLRLVLSLHTQGEVIYHRSGGRELLRARPAAEAISRMCGYRLEDADGLSAYGGLTDWCIQKMEIPAMTLECGKGQNPLPICDIFPIYARLKKALFLAPTMF